VNPAAAFLDQTHVDLAARVTSWSHESIRATATDDDEAARREARTLLAHMGDAGWYGAIERQDLRSLCVTREAIAAASPLADAVLALQALTATPILLAGTESQRRRWLPDLIGGRVMGAFVMTEPEAGSDVASMRTTARRNTNGWVLDGDKHLISNAGLADLHVVFAVTSAGRGSRGISAFLVPGGAEGLRFDGRQVLAAPHPLGRLVFDGCLVPEDALLGQLDEGFKLGMMTLDRVRPSVGAAACGMAARALDEAVRHARVRRQFGQPLGELQLVRAKLGEMATELDAARLLVYRAAWEKDRGAERITIPAAMAKSFATEAAQRIIDAAVQVVGGRGVLVGHPVEHLYRAVRALRIYEGATDVHRLIIGASLLEEGDRSESPPRARS
jgi:acyl-CoA dehydrogenase